MNKQTEKTQAEQLDPVVAQYLLATRFDLPMTLRTELTTYVVRKWEAGYVRNCCAIWKHINLDRIPYRPVFIRGLNLNKIAAMSSQEELLLSFRKHPRHGAYVLIAPCLNQQQLKSTATTAQEPNKS